MPSRRYLALALYAGLVTLVLAITAGLDVRAEPGGFDFLLGCDGSEAPSGSEAPQTGTFSYGDSALVVSGVMADGQTFEAQFAPPLVFPPPAGMTQLKLNTWTPIDVLDGAGEVGKDGTSDFSLRVGVGLDWTTVKQDTVLKSIFDRLGDELYTWAPLDALYTSAWLAVDIVGSTANPLPTYPKEVSVTFEAVYKSVDGAKDVLPIELGFSSDAFAAGTFPSTNRVRVHVAQPSWSDMVWAVEHQTGFGEGVTPPTTTMTGKVGDDIDVMIAHEVDTPEKLAVSTFQRCWDNPAKPLDDYPELAGPFEYVSLGTAAATPPVVDLDVKSAHLSVAGSIDGLPSLVTWLAEPGTMTLHREGPLAPGVSLHLNDTEPGDPYRLDLEVDGLPEWTSVNLDEAADGSSSFRLAFCRMDFDLDVCTTGLDQAPLAAFAYQDFTDEGDSLGLPPLPDKERWMYYAERTTTDVPEGHFRVGGRLGHVGTARYSSETGPSGSSEALTISAESAGTDTGVDVLVDTAEPHGSLEMRAGIGTLPSDLTLHVTTPTDPTAPTAIDWQASTPTALELEMESIAVVTPDPDSRTYAHLATPALPTLAQLELAEPTLDQTSIRWQADTQTDLEIREIALTETADGTTTGTWIEGMAQGVPESLAIDLAASADGATSVDVRGCADAWAAPDCGPQTAGAVGLVQLTAQSYPLDDDDMLAALDDPTYDPSAPAARWIGYASASEDAAAPGATPGTGPCGPPTGQSTGQWQAGGRLAGLQHLRLDKAACDPAIPLNMSAGTATLEGANEDVRIALDTEGPTVVHATGEIAALPSVLDPVRIVRWNVPALAELNLFQWNAKAPLTLRADVEIAEDTDSGQVPVAEMAIGGVDGSPLAQIPATGTFVMLDLEDPNPGTHAIWLGSGDAPEIGVRASLFPTEGDPLYIEAEIVDLPPAAYFSLRETPTGREADLRFCKGDWGTPTCAASVDAPEVVRIVVANHVADENLLTADGILVPDEAGAKESVTGGPASGPWVQYASKTNPADQSLVHWRAGAELSLVQHVRWVEADVANPLYTARGATARIDSAFPGANTDVVASVHSDTRHLETGPNPGQVAIVGSGWHVNGDIDAVPSSLVAGWIDLDLGKVGLRRLAGTASAPTTLTATLRVDDGGLTDAIVGAVSIGPDPSGGLPKSWAATLLGGSTCKAMPGGESPLEPGCFTWQADSSVHVVAGFQVRPEDRDPALWYRMHTDLVVPTSLSASWNAKKTADVRWVSIDTACRHDSNSSRRSRDAPTDFHVLPCNAVDVSLARGEGMFPPPPPLDLLQHPPEVDPPGDSTIAPVFSDTLQDVRVALGESRWDAHVRLLGLTHAEYRAPTPTTPTDVCVESQPMAVLLPFHVGVWIPDLTTGGTPSPDPTALYMDALLAERPPVVGALQFPDPQPGEPSVWVSTKECHPDPVTDLPVPGSQTSGIGIDAMVRVGRTSVLSDLLTAEDPADRTWTRPAGVDAHVETAPQGWAIDATLKTLVPDHLVFVGPDLDSCKFDAEMPLSYAECVEQIPYEAETRLAGSLKVLTSLETLGTLRWVFRDVGTDSTAERLAGDGLALPGNFAASFSLQDTERLGQMIMNATVNSANSAPIGSIGVEYGSSHTGFEATAAGAVPRYRITVENIGPKLHADIALTAAPDAGGVPNQVAEATAAANDPNPACTAVFDALDEQFGRSEDSSLGYVHATLDAGGHGEDLEVALNAVGTSGSLQIDPGTSPGGAKNHVDGELAIRLANVEINNVTIEDSDWDAGSVDGFSSICADFDLPVHLSFDDSTQLRLGFDGLEARLETDGGKAELELGEEIDGEFEEGVYFWHHDATFYTDVQWWPDYYKENSYWHTSFTAAGTPALAPPFLQKSPSLGQYADNALPYVTGGAGSVLFQLFFSAGEMDDMHADDDNDACTPDLGCFGERFWNEVWDSFSPPAAPAEYGVPSVYPWAAEGEPGSSYNGGAECDHDGPTDKLQHELEDGTVVTFRCWETNEWDWGELANWTARYQIEARFPNGSRRWIIPEIKGDNYDTDDTACNDPDLKHDLTWESLPAGHVRLTVHTWFDVLGFCEFFGDDDDHIATRTYIFGPSGEGGGVPNGTEPVTLGATVGELTSLAVPAPCTVGGNVAAVRWHHGDGSWVDVASANGCIPQAPGHTYEVADEYPALVIAHDSQGAVLAIMPVRVDVKEP